MLALADTRGDIGNYVSTLFTVYIIILLVYILTNLLFSFGLRPPYSRATDAVLGFLRDVSEPYLRVFRKFIPAIGMFDLSPMVAIIVLVVVDRLVVGAIGGTPS
jgi:YggT family protein